MQTHIYDLVRTLVGLAAGGVIGLAFGYLQEAALRRNARLEESGKLKSGWNLMPGSGARVAYLLIALALIQLVCPLLFTDGTQWVVSGGLVAGYGWTLYTQMRLRLKTMGTRSNHN